MNGAIIKQNNTTICRQELIDKMLDNVNNWIKFGLISYVQSILKEKLNNMDNDELLHQYKMWGIDSDMLG